MSPDLSQFRRPSDSVTPAKWRGPDGRVWERTGEKREPQPGEYIWFDASRNEPYLYRLEERPGTIAILNTPIWKLSEDQAWDPGEVKPVGPPSIEELIQQAQFAEDPLILARLQTLGILYQAQELQEIKIQLDQLTDIAGELDLIEMHVHEALGVIKPEE